MTESIAIVTGASRGIGQAIANRLAADSHRVFNLDIQAPPQTDGGTSQHEWIETDLSDVSATRRSIDQVLGNGTVSILVNNAAVTGTMTQLDATTVEDMDTVYAVNMRAPMVCTRHVIPGMQSAGYGRIVNIASRAHLGKTHRTSYGGTKGALVSMTRVWAIELAAFGITCNAVAPGPVRTELFEQANPRDMPRTQQIIDAIPVGRIGECDDIANAVSFFADTRAGYVTGQVLYVCGGTTLTRGGS